MMNYGVLYNDFHVTNSDGIISLYIDDTKLYTITEEQFVPFETFCRKLYKLFITTKKTGVSYDYFRDNIFYERNVMERLIDNDCNMLTLYEYLVDEPLRKVVSNYILQGVMSCIGPWEIRLGCYGVDFSLYYKGINVLDYVDGQFIPNAGREQGISIRYILEVFFYNMNNVSVVPA